VPVFFLLGRHDRHIPSVLAEQYFRSIEAPLKRLIWFEHSAHNPPFEEPGKFNRVLIEDVFPLARGNPGQERGSDPGQEWE
jgi:pimeloyl-ACP methyl ester carboxylesterase